MRACPNCYTYYNDGYICPQCGSQLVDYDPNMQYQQNPYDTTAQAYGMDAQGYDATGYQDPSYGTTPQQGYSANDNISNVAPAPPVTIVKTKKRTGCVTFLTLLLLLVGAVAGFLGYKAYEYMTKPTDIEIQVVESAWGWYSSLNALYGQMDDTGYMEQYLATNSNVASPASTTASNTAANEATATEGHGNAELPPEGTPDTAVATEEDLLTGQDPNVPSYMDDADVEAETSALEDAVESASGAAAADSNAQSGSADSGKVEMSVSLSSSSADIATFMNLLGDFAVIANNDTLQTINGPMQTMKEKFPDLVSAWDKMATYGIKDEKSAGNALASMSALKNAADDFKNAARDAGFETSTWH